MKKYKNVFQKKKESNYLILIFQKNKKYNFSSGLIKISTNIINYNFIINHLRVELEQFFKIK